LKDEVTAAGGRIDLLLAATALKTEDTLGWRKPAIGMAIAAQKQFPNIDFERSIMIGDRATDIQFGHQAGMRCILLDGLPNEKQKCFEQHLSFEAQPDLLTWSRTLA
jgi:histidinol phosphatase-like enzyme